MDRTKHTAVASPGTLEDKILTTNLWKRQDYTCSGYRACDCGGGHGEGAATRPAVERFGLGAETRPLKSQGGLPGGGSAPGEDPTTVVMGDSPGDAQGAETRPPSSGSCEASGSGLGAETRPAGAISSPALHLQQMLLDLLDEEADTDDQVEVEAAR